MGVSWAEDGKNEAPQAEDGEGIEGQQGKDKKCLLDEGQAERRGESEMFLGGSGEK